MLEHSTASSSAQNPILVDEVSGDLETMLLIITGRPHAALDRVPQTWDHVVQLYRLVEKYQLDGHQLWFSELCAKGAIKKPIEALIMACDRPSIDTSLAKYVISEGFPTLGADQAPFDSKYFSKATTQTTTAYDSHGHGYTASVRHALEPNNMTLDFRMQLGFRGLAAYTHTFKCLCEISTSTNIRPTPVKSIDWHALANDFVTNVRYIEAKGAASVSECHSGLARYSRIETDTLPRMLGLIRLISLVYFEVKRVKVLDDVESSGYSFWCCNIIMAEFNLTHESIVG